MIVIYRDTLIPHHSFPMEEDDEYFTSVAQPNPNNKAPLLSLTNYSSTNMELFNNLHKVSASMEPFNHGVLPFHNNVGFSSTHHHPLPLGVEGSTKLMGPTTPVFNPMAHFFQSDTMVPPLAEPEVHGAPSTSASRISFPETSKSFKENIQGQSYCAKKRKRVGVGREREETREVVHVRAKRGQATDSHSLAERLRREKINEKLRCLQDLVPGCYKTMGMAVMLDVIIDYVRSLQNQIDFLSMKLSAASLFYDFNSSEAEAIETIQGNAAYRGTQEMEKLMGEGYEGISQFQTANWPF